MPSFAQAIDREIRILKQSQHQHIIRLYEVIDSPTNYYLVMECAAGRRVSRAATPGRATATDGLPRAADAPGGWCRRAKSAQPPLPPGVCAHV